MAVGNNAAVVVRSRSPYNQKNGMVQTQGFDPRLAVSAAQEALELVNEASRTNDLGDITSSMPGLPFTCGSVIVKHGKIRVMWRMVGQIVVMVITHAPANAMAALDLLERCVRVVTFDFKSPEVSVDRFGKRYHEVYMALSALLDHAGTITGARALIEGRLALDAATTKRGKEGASQASPPQLPSTPEAPEGAAAGSQGGAPAKPKRRTLAAQSSQLPIEFGFHTDPIKGLHPTSGFRSAADGTDPRKSIPGTAFHQLAVMPDQAEDIFEALKAIPKAGAGLGEDGSPLDDMLGPPAGSKQQGPKKGEDPFAFVGEALNAGKKAAQPQGPPPPPVPPTPLLRLLETWKCEVKGAMVVRAGHVGEVSWLSEVFTTPIPAAGYALQYVPAAGVGPLAVQAVQDSLRAVRVMPHVVRAGWPLGYQVTSTMSDQGGEADLEGFTAEVAPSRNLLNPVITKFSVPVSTGPVPQPVRLLLDASIQDTPSGRETAVMLGLQIQLAPELLNRVASMEVRLHIPTLYELPARCRPIGAQMDGSRRILKWALSASDPPTQQPTLNSLCKEAVGFSAAFLVSGSVAAAKGVLRTVLAEVEVRGAAGNTLSGVMLRQHGFVGQTAQPAVNVCSWRALVTARI